MFPDQTLGIKALEKILRLLRITKENTSKRSYRAIEII